MMVIYQKLVKIFEVSLLRLASETAQNAQISETVIFHQRTFTQATKEREAMPLTVQLAFTVLFRRVSILSQYNCINMQSS